MSTIYSTGAVENAASNASTSVWVKVLNLSESQEITASVKVFKLNGQKTEIATSNFTVLPLSSDFDVFDIIDILQYEVQVEVSNKANALVTIWGKDANANLLAAHRFVQNELNVIGSSSSLVNNYKPTQRKIPRNSNRRTVRR